MEERQTDSTLDCCSACNHLCKQKSAAEKQELVFRPPWGGKKQANALVEARNALQQQQRRVPNAFSHPGAPKPIDYSPLS